MHPIKRHAEQETCSTCRQWSPVGTIAGRACGRCAAARSFHEDGGVLLSLCTPAGFGCQRWEQVAGQTLAA